MTILSIFTLFVALRLFLLVSSAPAPAPIPSASPTPASSSYWLASITRQGAVAYGDSSYQIFRNVMDFGAKGDGKSDLLKTRISIIYLLCIIWLFTLDVFAKNL